MLVVTPMEIEAELLTRHSESQTVGLRNHRSEVTMHSVINILAAVLLANSVTASPVDLILACRVDQSLEKRAFAGGWPLAASIRPADMIQAFPSFASRQTQIAVLQEPLSLAK